jgi:hypothetical protein
VTWELSGTYLEVCNCEAICPCRRIDGNAGGRSTYGECAGALSWRIVDGQVDGLDMAGLAVVLAIWYSDDEPGSPWSWVLYVDERADSPRRAALEDVFAGRLGGTPLSQFPWVFKTSHLLAVVPSRIQVDHTPGRGWFRAGSNVTVLITGPYDTQSPVTCVIPGHHRTGREVVAERLEVHADQLNFSYSGRCGYETTFAYSSAE